MRINKKKISKFVLFIVLSGICINWGWKNVDASEPVVIFAAASTTNAILEIASLYTANGLGQVNTSFASSSTLARQIANAAPADVYLSANKKWMDFLEEKGAIDQKSRFNLLGNRLVLIVPKQSSIQTIDIKKGMNLVNLFSKDGYISIGDPDHVPAGMYGKKAMEYLGIWDQVKNRLAPMKDVRAALVMVEHGETPIGLVYATDAAISKKVRVVGTFPIKSHPAIIYPVAAVTGGKTKEAIKFLNFLKTPEAKVVFEKYGFELR